MYDDEFDATATDNQQGELDSSFPLALIPYANASSTGAIESEIDSVKSLFKGWKAAELGALVGLWSLLGRIYSLAPAIDANPLAKKHLIERVSQDQALDESKIDDKPAEELLVVLVLGVRKETAARKSQWLKALSVGAMFLIPRSQSAFVDFMRDVGGIKGASKLVAPQRVEEHYSAIVAQLRKFKPSNSQPLAPPDPLSMVQREQPMGLILVEMGDWGKSAIPIATITSEKLIRLVHKFIFDEM